MKFLKYILLPIQIIYSIIILTRNILYDLNILKSYNSKALIISVGNIKAGGTGKTPLTEYLIQLFDNKKIAILSRGYKRKTRGFILVNQTHSSMDVGDENRQLYNKFKSVIIACDNNRVHGIKQLLRLNEKIEVIILDDAYQHRSIYRDIDILLTEYDNLLINDQLIPIGKLREHRREMKRANIIIITKCPLNISEEQKNEISKKMNLKSHQTIYFSEIKKYNFIDMCSSRRINISKNENHILLTGIENPKKLLDFLTNQEINYQHINFKDHHNFKESDISTIINLKNSMNHSNNLLLTEKDYYRFSKNHKKILEKNFNLICVQIEIDFIGYDKYNFNNQLLNFKKTKMK